MHRLLYRIIIVFLLGIQVAVAQDSIVFMDGTIKLAKVQLVDDANEVVVFNQKEDSKYIYAKTYEKYDVLYVRFGNSGRKRYVYEYDTATGNLLQPKEMEMFVLGEQYNRLYYRTPMSAVFGAVIGVAGAHFLSFYSLLTPPISYFLVNIKKGRKPIDKGLAKFPPSYMENILFVNGYREMAKRKKSRMALLGGIVGSVGGIVLEKVILK